MFTKLFKYVCLAIKKRMRLRNNIYFVIGIFIFGILVGSLIYYYLEGWGFLDSFYFVVVTVTTIGFGDLTPTTNAGKLFTIFYSFFGVAIALYILSRLSGSFFKKQVSSKVSEIKRGVKKEKELKDEVEKTIKDILKEKAEQRRKNKTKNTRKKSNKKNSRKKTSKKKKK